jgi:hypothetical protein
MIDIDGFIEVRVAEDEAKALNALHSDAVRPGVWSTEHHAGDPPRCHVAEDRAGHYWTVADQVFVPNAEHMAHHDPARVLRDVETKRRILKRHRPVSLVVGGPFPVQLVCSTCLADYDPGGQEPYDCSHSQAPWPCVEIKDLCAAYECHPEFREEWRVVSDHDCGPSGIGGPDHCGLCGRSSAAAGRAVVSGPV